MTAAERIDHLSELLRERNRTQLASVRAERAVASFLEVCEAGVQEGKRRATGRACRPVSGYPELAKELITSRPWLD